MKIIKTKAAVNEIIKRPIYREFIEDELDNLHLKMAGLRC